ncbi:MAG: MBL fold metallo-hydrolase [Candidatus Omnitrophica bacterium]|nr:MBL fold metallo-hydrolase [Candidatus Omnitrophota bacterium]MBI2174202.1 MBL fold metallo-hydrolase [Candidatus Omnitrophota bacterium]MBI3009668.1 MBL fold metallo-hydrolase [Candidatus Omnitrophota bacterium]
MPQAPSIYFKQLLLGPMQNFIYLIGDPQSRKAAVVDPGWEVPHILETLKNDGYQLADIFVTHHHFDHVMGLEELLKAVDVPVHVHREDAPMLKVQPSSIKPISGGENLTVGKVPIHLLHTPGHTPGSQCLLVEGRVLSGDTLFIGSCGRCDLPGGNPKALYESLSKRLKALDDATIVCPGHHYASEPTRALGEEKRDNPFLAAPTVADFLRLVGF